ncbi:ATP-binding protein [Actinomadura rupiterrae]|uniref:ATP-binding protein n=1 Tax=Actinomadura rupiterrae TaxID=559627 RepID=UPI0020A5B26A|nr:ATP-binding protein [Actinomadura rupiterrae]MCP2337381.1 anti-sigma regulatory factor (Ser/Thr protein kinase) [Actinomadura rupiterrae]
MKCLKHTPGSAAEFLWGSEEMRWRRTYAGRPEQARAAREFARTLFSGALCVDVAEFIVRELVANTIRHTRSGKAGGWFGLEVVYDDPAYVAVVDLGGGGIPIVKTPDEFAESGRGLYAVARLAERYGIERTIRQGHKVWAEFHLDKPLADLFELEIPPVS